MGSSAAAAAAAVSLSRVYFSFSSYYDSRSTVLSQQKE